jgi:hypothetical protein
MVIAKSYAQVKDDMTYVHGYSNRSLAMAEITRRTDYIKVNINDIFLTIKFKIKHFQM